eukprot:6213791-Pleurochrysis_carterae.AAC.1
MLDAGARGASAHDERPRQALRAELSAVRTQTACRDFWPHLGNCCFMQPKCKFFPCNCLKNETRIVLRGDRMALRQQGGRGGGGQGAGPSRGSW